MRMMVNGAYVSVLIDLKVPEDTVLVNRETFYRITRKPKKQGFWSGLKKTLRKQE